MTDANARMRIWYQSFIDPEVQTAYFDVLKRHLDRVADADTTVEIHGIKPPVTELHGLSEARSARHVVRNIIQAEAGGYDAFVIGHFQEGGINEAKAIADIPVLGLGETSMLFACTLARRIGLVTIDPIYIPWHADQIALWGLKDRVAGIRAMATTPADYMRAFDTEAGFRDVLDQFRTQAEPLVAAGAEVLIPAGGLPMLLLARDKGLTIDGASVLNGVTVTLKMAEAAVKLRRLEGIGVSRAASFAKPSQTAIDQYLDTP